MADRQFYTAQASIAKAGFIKTSLVTSKVRFFKNPDLQPNAFTTRAELLAAECDFDGYTAGGYALAAWTGPANTPGGGATLTSPVVNAAYGPAGTPPVANSVGGWWVDDDSAPTPQVRVVGVYDPPRPMGAVGDIITWIDQIVEGKNPPAPAS